MRPVRPAHVSLAVNGVTVRRDGVWIAALTPEQTKTIADAARRILDHYAQTAELPKSA